LSNSTNSRLTVEATTDSLKNATEVILPGHEEISIALNFKPTHEEKPNLACVVKLSWEDGANFPELEIMKRDYRPGGDDDFSRFRKGEMIPVARNRKEEDRGYMSKSEKIADLQRQIRDLKNDDLWVE